MDSQNGFLLSYIKYGDNDAVLHCFTREKGFQSYFARGIYSSKNKKKAYLLPLNELNFTFSPHRNGSIQTVSKIELLENPEFYNDVKANMMVFFVADFLNQVLRNENQQQNIYNEILRFLDELEKKNYRSHLIFLIKILKIQGLLPLVTPENYLDPETGSFFSEQLHPVFGTEISDLWKTLISAEDPYLVMLNTSARKDLLESILVYYHYHYTDFRTPDSLEIVQQIFE
ncbi:MAG: DNA repair protein RecO [Kaistella sp.]|nr:DNA repair protein RecO [Kaistella sp.]